MDHIQVLKRAWEITWHYRVLWIFGIIIALVTAGGSPNNPGDPGNRGDVPVQYEFHGEDWPFWRDFEPPEIPAEVFGVTIGVVIAIFAALVCFILLLSVAFAIARYVSETALIRMVDDYEGTGEKRRIRDGFRLGWSRSAWRLFLINLVINLPTAVVFIVLFLLPIALITFSAIALDRGSIAVAVGVVGIVAGVGLIFLAIFLAIVVGVALILLKHFFRRACVLENRGVFDAIRAGFGVVKRHLKDAVIMEIIMIGLGLAWALLMIPVTILLLILGIVVIAPLALVVGGLATFLGGPVMWILAAIFGIPLLILVMGAPLLFLNGLTEVFTSSTWTLTYRELRALEGMQVEPEALDTSDLD